MNKRVRLALAACIVLLTVAGLVYYLRIHRSLITQLGHISPALIVEVLGLYIAWFVTLVLILAASLRVCRVLIPASENILLNAYSLFVNYFIPGQGGPALRGAYLKKRRGLRIKDYVSVTLLYYACYALVSIYLVLAGILPWWQVVGVVLLILLIALAVVRMYGRHPRFKKVPQHLLFSGIWYLLAVTLAQAIVQICIYGIELHAVVRHVALNQIITYTGTANLALFVGLTPGAIGIRESFLLFSEHLHHITSSEIVAASVIDRVVYLLFLGVIFLLTVGFHAKDRFRLKPDRSQEKLL